MLCSQNIRFVIFSSYGNDSCALIQWAHEWQLEGVAVVYSDTGWATVGWEARIIVSLYGGIERVPMTSEAETMTIIWGNKPVTDRKGKPAPLVAGLFRRVETDYSKVYPCYRHRVHETACDAAASRVVRAWQLKIATEGMGVKETK